MAATERGLAALMQAALALPILVVPARAGAAEISEVGFSLLGYKEKGLMKVTEPIVWAKARVGDDWEFSASAAVDIVSGASPQLVSNRTGTPVQTITGASIDDRRKTWDVRAARKWGDATFAITRLMSREEDYLSHAYGLEARYDLNQKNTTLIAGYGQSNDRISSSDDPNLHERRDTREWMLGVVQVISPVAAVQTSLTHTQGEGWYNDPYKLTFTFYPTGLPVAVPDRRPSSRDTLAWITRYRHHFEAAHGTLQADYRYYHDDWGIRAHTLEVGWSQSIGDRWTLRPGLRYYTQTAADFYGDTAPRPVPPAFSSDQRLGAFGGLSPSLKVGYKLERGPLIEGSLGYVHNARSLKLGGQGSPAFETLRAVFGIVSIVHEF